MIRAVKQTVIMAPTPMAGLALGIASLGWSWESLVNFHHYGQWFSAAIASLLLRRAVNSFFWFAVWKCYA